MSDHPNTLRVERAAGSVTIKHHDAVLASSNGAMIVHGEREAPVYYIPKNDVYFEHLIETGPGELPSGRPATFWSVKASGSAVENGAWLIENDTQNELSGYVGFDPAQLSVLA